MQRDQAAERPVIYRDIGGLRRSADGGREIKEIPIVGGCSFRESERGIARLGQLIRRIILVRIMQGESDLRHRP